MKKILFLFLVGIFVEQLSAQCSIYFSYDNGGNRIKRYYCAPVLNIKIDESMVDDSNIESRENDKQLLQEVAILPNPTDGKVIVQNWEIIDQNAIDVFDSNGRQILHEHLSSREIDLSKFSSGLYYFRYRIKNEQKLIKIIKSN